MTVFVYAEAKGDTVATSTLENLTKARELGDTVEAIYAGSNADAIAATLGEYGVAKVHALDTGDALPGAIMAAALPEIVQTGDLMIFATSYDGRDVAARFSARTDAPIISNVVGITPGDDIQFETAIFGAIKIVQTSFRTDKTKIALTRPKSFTAESSGGSPAEVATISMPETGAAGQAKILESHEEELEGPKLEEAAVVVSGGRGLGGAEHYSLVEKVAGTIGAATGASRAIVDAGWVPYSKQVGQTGKTVKPDVYIALGISGAMQHMVGMKHSKSIIAINKDPEAPIHAIADLGIVGDVHRVVPQLIEALEAKKG